MGRFWSHRPPGRPGDRSAARRRRRRRLEVCPLESRELMAITGISEPTVSPQVLVPPDGRFVPVTVSGAIADDLPTPPVAMLHVIDEYRRVNTVARIPLTRRPVEIEGGTLYDYSFTFRLEASRADQDVAGRQYYAIITVTDPETAGARVVPVIVPHDRRHLPSPDDGAGDEAARPASVRGRPRPPVRLMPGSGRRTGRRGGPG